MLPAFLLLLPPAEACQCIGADATLLSPAFDATGVPTNARIWVWAWQGLNFNPDDWAAFTEAGETLGPLEIRTQGVDQAFLLEFRFPEELPPNTVVTVIDSRSKFEQLRFTTGDTPDEEPPTWGGKYTVDLGNEEFCEEMRWISFVLEGAEDNSGQELVVQLRPKGEGLEIWGTTTVLGPYWSGQCGGDESLEQSLHRGYDVSIYDVAGNELGAGEVSSCGGCDGAGGGAAGLGLLGVLAGGRRRRRG